MPRGYGLVAGPRLESLHVGLESGGWDGGWWVRVVEGGTGGGWWRVEGGGRWRLTLSLVCVVAPFPGSDSSRRNSGLFDSKAAMSSATAVEGVEIAVCVRGGGEG